jgi:hypothetical protein
MRKRISKCKKNLKTLALKDSSFLDSRGAFLKVSAIINYRIIIDALQADMQLIV